MSTNPLHAHRARVAGLRRHRPVDDPEVVDATAALKAAAAERYVRELVDGWPPLRDEQRARLAEILQPVGLQSTSIEDIAEAA